MALSDSEESLKDTPRAFQFGSFLLDPDKRLLLASGTPVPLTPKAFETLLILVKNCRRLVTKDELMSSLWPETFVEEGSLTRNISTLRKALGESPHEHRYIVTIPGKGYQFVAPVREIKDSDLDISMTERTKARIVVTEVEESEESTPEAGPSDLNGERQVRSPSLPAIRWPYRRFWVIGIGLAAVSVAVFTLFLVLRTPAPRAFDPDARHMSMTALTTGGNVEEAALSPDGRFLVYTLNERPGVSSLWIRRLPNLSNIEILPAFPVRFTGVSVSPDGSYVYYVTVDSESTLATLHRVPLLGGPVRKLASHVDSKVTFSPDGRKIAFRRNYLDRGESALFVADAEGGNERQIASLQFPDFFGAPAWSPDGERIACAAGHAEGGMNRYVFVIRTSDWGVEPRFPQRWRWINDLAWLRDSSGLVMIASESPASPYQVWHLSFPGGEARRITNDSFQYGRLDMATETSDLLAIQVKRVNNVWMIPKDDPLAARRITFGTGGFRGTVVWTPDDRLVFESALFGFSEISEMQADGTHPRNLLGDMTGRAITSSPAVSADGRFIYFASDLTGTRHIWRINRDGSDPVQMTFGDGEDYPACSPDGKWLVYNDIYVAQPAFWRIPTEGGEPEKLTDGYVRRPSISPDGRWIAGLYRRQELDSFWHLAVFPSEGGPPTRIFPQELRVPTSIRWTRDGRFLTYADNRDGSWNIRLQPMAGGDPIQLTRFQGDIIFGFDWSIDGRWLACVRGLWERNLVLLKDFL